jgi:ornithine cyclodeaminase/alanine dehydrogenase-like protein (mu-crystallin family)
MDASFPLPETLILTRAEVAALAGPAEHLAAAEAAFRALADGGAICPAPFHLPLPEGGVHAKGARLAGPPPRAAVKVNANVPGNPARRGLPTIQGTVLLIDAENGRTLAVMDSVELTLRRTAAATALAARLLARPDSVAVAICGCGAQAGPQLEALRGVLPLRKVRAWDAAPERARAFAAVAGGGAHAVDTLAEAVDGADVIVTCTTAQAPFLEPVTSARVSSSPRSAPTRRTRARSRRR